MPLDINMSRWIFASIRKYVTDNPNNLVHRFQGDDRTPDTTDEFCEWRLTTPRATSLTLSETKEVYTLDCFVSADNSKDADRIRRNVGIVMGMFIDFQIYRFGADPDVDDSSLVGCLQRRREVDSSFFGQVGPKVGVEQSAVFATYQLNYTGA